SVADAAQRSEAGNAGDGFGFVVAEHAGDEGSFVFLEAHGLRDGAIGNHRNAVDVASREGLNFKFELQRDIFGVVQLRRGFDFYADVFIFGAGIRRLGDGGIGNEAGGTYDQRDLAGGVGNIVGDYDVRESAIGKSAGED